MIRILLAGQGGQGVLSAGKMLAESGLWEGKEVSYLPAYGPEMRGGTANCSVIISDEEIASPLCNNPDVLIAMNGPSFHKFAPRVRSGGIVIVGALCQITHIVKDKSIINCLNEKFVGKPALMEINARAFELGKAAVESGGER